MAEASAGTGTALRVGVTGHRVLPADPAFSTQLHNVPALLRRVPPGGSGASTITVISSLAEGADRLVAARLLDAGGAALHVALPLPAEDYQCDFTRMESRRAFYDLLARAATVVTLPPAATREDAYLAAGLYVLAHCDVLIALWDGLPPRGPSGTGAIVARARAAGLPLLWIETVPPYRLHAERFAALSARTI